MNQDKTEGKSATTLKKQPGVTVNDFFNGSGCRIMTSHWVQLLDYSKIVEAIK